MQHFRSATVVLIFFAGATRASAINIVMDYSNDAFFASHPVAKATLEMAAADVGGLLTTPLGATTDTSTGTAPDGSSITINFTANYRNPTTGASGQSFDPVVVPDNQVTIFVGVRPLGTGVLGI